MNLVRQPEAKGCGIACASMVTGIPYDKICERFGRRFEENGIHIHALLQFMAECGYANMVKFRFDGIAGQNTFIPAWPPEPFAPYHIVSAIQPSGNTHFVVMTQDGDILDPMQDGVHSLSEWETFGQPEFKGVQRVDGFFKVICI